MPTEATPDRTPRSPLTARQRPPSAPRRPPFVRRWPLSAPRPAPTAAPSSPPTGRCSPPERTYAAWVRTGLMSLAAGVGAKKTLGGVLPEWVVVLTGSVLVAFAAFRCRGRERGILRPGRRARPARGGRARDRRRQCRVHAG